MLAIVLIRQYNKVAKKYSNLKQISLFRSNGKNEKDILGFMFFYTAFYYYQFEVIVEGKFNGKQTINDEATKKTIAYINSQQMDLKEIMRINSTYIYFKI